MAETAEQENSRLELARTLVDHLENGKVSDAELVVAELAGINDSVLFQEVGRLTRELHDSISSFVMDARLTDIVEIAEVDMPDAAERLRYVIATTEQAANTTLNAVEESLPLADTLRSDAHHLAHQWERFNSRQLTVDDFRGLSSELMQFLSVTQANSEALHAKLSEILLAQGYQDITGQVIRRVIDLVNDVEKKLVTLIRVSGGHARKGSDSQREQRTRDIGAHGPAVPGVDKGDIVTSQDDVDDLLSSLGF